MKAARLTAFGSSENLQVVDIAEPGDLAATDLLVRVVASGVNPIEMKIRSGALAQALGRPLPVTLGWECSGTVEAVGGDVAGFAVGDEVYAYPTMARDGTHAEFVVIDEDQLAIKPGSLSFEQSAAVPVTSQAAWSMLEVAGNIEGRRVIVHGAGGAVGHWLVQLAKHRGAIIVATVAGADIARALGLGADEAIDYREQRFETKGKFDVVFDMVGGETQTRSWNVLNRGGRLISIVMPPDAARAKAAGADGSFVDTQPRGEVLTEIAALIDAGRLKPLQVDNQRPLGDAGRVHAEIEAGTLRGKTILTI
jgi:NADPH:quinone reductase-like Zn-dependent oxidoreductase